MPPLRELLAVPSDGGLRDVELIEPGQRRRYAWEIVAVLGVSLGMSGIYALLSLIRAEVTIKGGIANATATVESVRPTPHPWLDLADHLADLTHGVFPAVLALVLLAHLPAGRGFGIGFDLRRPGRELLQGFGLFALIGIPGLGLVFVAHALGLNASLQVVDSQPVWYRVPYLVLAAAQNGLLEEVVVLAYLLTRLRELGMHWLPAVLIEATIRGSYHLYQGFGGFAGNFVMGLIFGYFFTRSRRVMPFVIAHTLLDVASFVGYVYLHPYISWI